MPKSIGSGSTYDRDFLIWHFEGIGSRTGLQALKQCNQQIQAIEVIPASPKIEKRLSTARGECGVRWLEKQGGPAQAGDLRVTNSRATWPIEKIPNGDNLTSSHVLNMAIIQTSIN